MNDTSSAASCDDIPVDSTAYYDQFFGPLFFEPYANEVAKRIDPTHVNVTLEIAAGTGRVTRHIRERLLAPAKLIASDISGDARRVLSPLYPPVPVRKTIFAFNEALKKSLSSALRVLNEKRSLYRKNPFGPGCRI